MPAGGISSRAAFALGAEEKPGFRLVLTNSRQRKCGPTVKGAAGKLVSTPGAATSGSQVQGQAA
eukprot:4821753-Amphidinium_carterae.1